MPVKALQSKIRYLESRLHFLWNRDIEPCFWCSEYEELDPEDLKGHLSAPTWFLQQRSQEFTISDAYQGSKQKTLNPKDSLDALHEGKNKWAFLEHHENSWTEAPKIEHPAILARNTWSEQARSEEKFEIKTWTGEEETIREL